MRYFAVPAGGPANIIGYTGLAASISADLQIAQANSPIVRVLHVADITTYNTKAALPYNLSVPCNATVTAPRP